MGLRGPGLCGRGRSGRWGMPAYVLAGLGALGGAGRAARGGGRSGDGDPRWSRRPPQPRPAAIPPAGRGGMRWDGMERVGTAAHGRPWSAPVPPPSRVWGPPCSSGAGAEPGWGAQLPPAGSGGRGGAALRCLPPAGPRRRRGASPRRAPARPVATILGENPPMQGKSETPEGAGYGSRGGRAGSRSTCPRSGPS